MKKRDIILIIIIVAIIGQLLFINKFMALKNADKVVIYFNNKLYRECSINDEETINIKSAGIDNVISIHDGGVEMTHANCPDKVCVKTGFISKPGQSIVCIPHKINIKIVSDDSSDSGEILAR